MSMPETLHGHSLAPGPFSSHGLSKKIEKRFGHLKRILRLGPGGDAIEIAKLAVNELAVQKDASEGGREIARH